MSNKMKAWILIKAVKIMDEEELYKFSTKVVHYEDAMVSRTAILMMANTLAGK